MHQKQLTMNLNVLISTSRRYEVKPTIEIELRRALGDDIGEIVESEDFPMNPDIISPQGRINEQDIANSDWFILLAPLDHVGCKTFDELKAACESYLETGKPTISIFHSRHPVPCPAGEDNRNVPVSRMMDYISDTMDRRWTELTGENKKEEDKEQYYIEFDSVEELLFNMVKQFRIMKDRRIFKAMNIRGFIKKGRDIIAPELYYDKNRASAGYGFDEHKYLRRKSVDEKLEDVFNSDLDLIRRKIAIITGAPGSGKTRAVYEYVKHTLAGQDVIILNSGNIQEVLIRLRLFKECTQSNKNDLFLICDQIKDVMSALEKEEVKEFFEIVVKCPEVYFIGTSIASAYNSFIGESDSRVSKILKDETYCRNIDIPKIQEDYEHDNIVNWLNSHYPTSGGQTIGDFIPGLKGYVNNILERIYSKASDKQIGRYIEYFMKGIQLHSLFRKTFPDPLFIPVMITRAMLKDRSESEFEENCKVCINYLTSINYLSITRNGKPSRLEKSFDFDEENEYDDEEFITLIPTDFSYSVNELVEEEIYNGGSSRNSLISFNIESEDGITDAISVYSRAFPSHATFRRIIPRLPVHRISQECVRAAMDKTRSLLKSYIKKHPEYNDNPDIMLAYSLLIGRAECWDEALSIFGEMKKYGIGIDANTIGEIYRFAGRHHDEKETAVRFAGEIQQKYGISDSLYTYYRKLDATTCSFDEAAAQVEDILDIISECSGDTGSLDYANAQEIFNLLCKRVRNIENCRNVLKLFDRASLTMNLDNLYTLVKAGNHNREYLDAVYSMILGDKAEFQSELKRDSFEMVIVILIRNAPDYRTSYGFYLKNRERSGKDNHKLFALCLKNAVNFDFQAALRHESELSDRPVNPIIYNLLLRIAPSIDDAAHILPKTSVIDDFSINNLLSSIKYDSKSFIFAYQLINRPEFRDKRDSIHVIGNLFKFATAKAHEAYIMDMIERDPVDSEKIKSAIENSAEINSIKIRKEYRTLEESFQILESYVDKSREDRIKADIFSSFLSKLNDSWNTDDRIQEFCGKFSSKMNEKMQNQKGGITLDEYFYSALYRTINRDRIVNDGKVCQGFIDDFEKAKPKYSKTFANIIKFLQKQGHPFRDLYAVYTCLLDWYSRYGKPETLIPGAGLFHNLLKSASIHDEAVLVQKGMAEFGQSFQDRNSIDLARKVGSRYHVKFNCRTDLSWPERIAMEKSPDGKFALLEKIYDEGNFTISILNSALMNLTKVKKDRERIYGLCMGFIRRHNLEEIMTDLTFAPLVITVISPDECRELIGMVESRFTGKGYISEILFGAIAVNKVCAGIDISINRRYFEKWRDIYRDLKWEFQLESNWDTLYSYLNIEINHKLKNNDGSSDKIIQSILLIYEEYGRTPHIERELINSLKPQKP